METRANVVSMMTHLILLSIKTKKIFVCCVFASCIDVKNCLFFFFFFFFYVFASNSFIAKDQRLGRNTKTRLSQKALEHWRQFNRHPQVLPFFLRETIIVRAAREQRARRRPHVLRSRRDRGVDAGLQPEQHGSDLVPLRSGPGRAGVKGGGEEFTWIAPSSSSSSSSASASASSATWLACRGRERGAETTQRLIQATLGMGMISFPFSPR